MMNKICNLIFIGSLTLVNITCSKMIDTSEVEPPCETNQDCLEGWYCIDKICLNLGGSPPKCDGNFLPGEYQEEECGLCGQRRRMCDDDGTFREWSQCESEGICSPGQEDIEDCYGGKKERICNDTCQWGDWSECSCGNGNCESDKSENCESCPADCYCNCGEECIQEQCVFTACENKDCGPDGCGGNCGSCDEHYACEQGVCIYQPWCGDDNCDPNINENCESCPNDCPCLDDQVCYEAACCTPICESEGKQCGDDGCGGNCGECDEHYACEEGICVFQPCNPEWSCTAWSDCSCDNNQTRTCTDLNNCGTDEGKPMEIQSCDPCGNDECDCEETCLSCQQDCGQCPCTPNWSCTDWSNCSCSNTQTRSCNDLNDCGTNEGKPVESQSCQHCGDGFCDSSCEDCCSCAEDCNCSSIKFCLNCPQTVQINETFSCTLDYTNLDPGNFGGLDFTIVTDELSVVDDPTTIYGLLAYNPEIKILRFAYDFGGIPAVGTLMTINLVPDELGSSHARVSLDDLVFYNENSVTTNIPDIFVDMIIR